MQKNKLLTIFNLSIFVIFNILSLLMYFPVDALSSKEIKSRNVCNNLAYELAYAQTNGNLETKSCYSTYQEAKNVMDTSTEDNSDNLVILERKDSNTAIIDAKHALVDYDQKTSIITELYKNLNDRSSFTYIIGGSSDDAAYLGIDIQSRRIKIMVSGFTGWMDKYDENGNNQYDIIPLAWVSSPSYYKITNSNITHYLPGNLFGTKEVGSITYGPKPTQLATGTYYSYDGKYFYTNLKTMLNDYKNGNRNNSVNPTQPYYNYYLYLSHRTKSTYTATDINDYITNTLGYTSKATTHPVPSNKQSMLFNEGNSFYSAESFYGTNSLLMFGVARNESGNGRSWLSVIKNNIFGHNAVDSNPGGNGDKYDSIGYGIFAHAYRWLSYGFLQPGDINYRFNGSHLGNKAAGVNVKYASDPYWGEKAAEIYYQFDYKFGLQDYNYYSIAVKNDSTTTVYPKKTPSSSGLNVSSKYYKLTLQDTPIVIVEEVQGSEVNGNSTWYKIMSDPILDSSLEYIGSSTSKIKYHYYWDSNYVYVPAAYFTKINDTSCKKPSDIIKYEEAIDLYNQSSDNNTSNNNNTGTTQSTPSTINPDAQLELKNNNLYYFEDLSFKNNNLNVSGFLAITGMHNRKNDSITHKIIFKNVDNSTEYIYKLDRWLTGVPFEMTNADEKTKYDYSGGWFKGTIDVSNLPQGDYQVFIEQSNGKTRTRTHFNNLFFKEMVRKFTTTNGKGFDFQMNYYDKNVPLEVKVRDAGLISSSNPPTTDSMYNSFEKLAFVDNSLYIRGTSHSIGVDYGAKATVEREIILENISTYERYKYNASSITNGDYVVSLRVSDGKSKTRAWFDTKLDLSSVPKGVYAIYIKTKSQGYEDYGELNDVLYTTINQKATIAGKNMYLRRVDEKRFRIELVIE